MAALGSSLPSPGQGCSVPLVQPALAVGFTVVALGHCFGEISGAQMNPAVTLAFLATRKLDILRTACYILGQCLGATLGAGILYLTLPLKSAAECYVNKVYWIGHMLGTVLAVFSLTLSLPLSLSQVYWIGHMLGTVLAVFSLTLSLPLSLSQVYWIGHMLGTVLAVFSLTLSLPLSLSQVYWIGPMLGAVLAVFSLTLSLPLSLSQVYWIGPMLGAVLAGLSHEFFFAASASRQKLIACLTCKDIEIMEMASASRSSLSTVTQSAMRAKHTNKNDHN
ncbi:UNVERIFIED_CONTAM: hypothetical protein FKN15_056165 [Acipenser sinensis]